MKTPRLFALQLAAVSLALTGASLSTARAEAPSPFAEKVDAAAEAWQKSCLAPDAQGRCLATEKQPGSHRCASNVELWRPGKRRGVAARRAQKQLQALIAQHRAAAQKSEVASDRSAFARALFHAAESRLERALLLRAPTGLNFSEDRPARKKRSMQRFKTFLAELQTHIAEVGEAYREVVRSSGDGALQARAAHRTALLLRQSSKLLTLIEIPIDVRSGPYRQDSIDAFCDALAQEAEPMAAQAQAAAERCAQLAEAHDLKVECGLVPGH